MAADDTMRQIFFYVCPIHAGFGVYSGLKDFAVQEQSGENLTELLIEWRNGSDSALDRLIPYVMPELRRLAGYYLRGERPGHILQTTALVNEAWLKLVQQTGTPWDSRAHFFAVAARTMRHILIDYARSRRSAKRGGEVPPIDFQDALAISDQRCEHLLLLDVALQKLARTDPRRSRVFELRYFGGMNVEETAKALDVSPNTVIHDWRFAKAWLRLEIGCL